MTNASNDTKTLVQNCISKDDMTKIKQLVDNLVNQKEIGQIVYQGQIVDAIMELFNEKDDKEGLITHLTPKLGENTLQYR